MIKGIIDMLKRVDGDTENIRIAQGKYKLTTKWKDVFKTLKRNIKWGSI